MADFLVDTSVFVDYFNGFDSLPALELDNRIKKNLRIAICPVILQEVLQGIRSDLHYNTVKDVLLSFEILHLNEVAVALEAAEMFRFLRRKGLTVRKGVDCLIALYSIKNNLPLLHKDHDFLLIAKYFKLQMVSV
jgi:predicted nucleic acid-binding protein